MYKLLRCKTCKKEMMPCWDNNGPLDCETCNPENIEAYKKWYIDRYEFKLEDNAN